MDKKLAMFCLCALIAIFVIPTAIRAASFNCSKASTKTEKAICSDPMLSRLDEDMAAAYSKALKTSDRDAVKKEQRKWLKEILAPCIEDKACIRKAYENRLRQLGYDAESQKAVTDDEENEDITRSLTMTCDYSDYETFQSESVSITQTTENLHKPAGIKIFKRGKDRHEFEIFIVRPGQFAECIYPSGTRVRVKVGEGTSRAYGECGADPEVFMSLWVNERKIASRVWFAGHCIESRRENPDVSFKITGVYDGVSVKKCHSTKRGTINPTTKKDAAEPLSVCVDFPDVSKYPKDFLEYPRQGTKVPKIGDIELLKGSDAVCQAVLDELRADFNTFSHTSDQSKSKLTRPNWNDSTVKLPEELAGSSESIFDFDNDGKLDRVFDRSFYNTYMAGDVLLVQYGNSPSRLNVSDSPMEEASGFFPCQMSEVRHKIHDCPPFSQENDEAGFSMEGRNSDAPVYFRARYSTIDPFSFQGANYIEASTMDEEAKDFVAILKPLPDRTFQKMCLFRRISENF
jgi:uncharacterized protein